MPTQKKADQIQEIVEKIQNAAAIWYIDARGLTVKETQQLRRNVTAAGGEMKVYKNTLAVRALAQLELPTCEEILAGPTAFIFAGEDVAAPAKAANDVAKKNKNLEIKGGLMDGAVMSAEEVTRIASLPSRDQLIGQIACSLTAVASQLAIAFGEMSEKEAA